MSVKCLVFGVYKNNYLYSLIRTVFGNLHQSCLNRKGWLKGWSGSRFLLCYQIAEHGERRFDLVPGLERIVQTSEAGDFLE